MRRWRFTGKINEKAKVSCEFVLKVVARNGFDSSDTTPNNVCLIVLDVYSLL